MSRQFTKYPSNYVKASTDWQEKAVKVRSDRKPTFHKAFTKDLGDGYFAEVVPEYQHNKNVVTWVASIYKDGHIDRFDSFSTESDAKQYADSFVMASTSSKYPTVTVCLNANGERKHMASGNLDSAKLVQDIVSAMKLYDDFAEAMADMVNPDLNNQPWEDTIYEDIAADAVDWFKQDYNEWKSLKDRGREDSDFWALISDDESIEVFS